MTPEWQTTKFEEWIKQTIMETREWQERIKDDLDLLEDTLIILEQVGMDLPNASKIIKTIMHIRLNMRPLTAHFNNLKED